MLKVIRTSSVSRIISFTILVSLVFAPNGCYYYRINNSVKPYAPAIEKLHQDGRFVILHADDTVWHLTDISVDEIKMTAVVNRLSDHDMYKKATYDNPIRYRKSKIYDESEVLNEVHIFTSGITISELDTVKIPLDSIEKIDVYDRATGATIASWGLATLGTAATAFGVLMIIVLLTKSSCPFIYAHDGTDYLFCGEVFSGAIQPGLVRDDYFPLPDIMPLDKDYMVKITNEVMEIQYTDLAELIIVDHNAGANVLFDKYGNPCYWTEACIPFMAISSSNEDILSLIKEEDQLLYTGLENSFSNSNTEELIIGFIKPEDAVSAKLIVRARNSFWMEAVIAKIHSYFGGRYDNYMLKQESRDAKSLTKYQIEQDMPLSVYLKKNEIWEFADYFNLAGPMALREDILQIDVSDIPNDTIEIKLTTGFGFWEVDYVAMDFDDHNQPDYISILPKRALDNHDMEVTSHFTAVDNLYYRFAETDDEVTLRFTNPVIKNEERSLFLHTRGYYQITREQSGKPDRKTLRTFQKPGSIAAFSRETFRSIYNN